MDKRSFFVFAFAMTLIAPVLAASQARATPWINADYLARWAFWGLRHQVSPSDDYKMFPYRTIDNAPPAYQFPRAPAGAIPVEVEYKDCDAIKRVALDELLESTGTHAFIVTKDGK